MEVRIGVLADYASISDGSKLNIMGIFTNILTATEPAVHPQMMLVAQFEFNSSECGEKNLKIVLVEEDGQDIFSISGKVQIERAADGGPSLLNQILRLNAVVFPKVGQYEFRIVLDGIMACSIPLRVIRVSPLLEDNK
jgi:hypothetical protein